MSKAFVIDEAQRIALYLSELLSLDRGSDFQRVAAALAQIAADPPPIPHIAWQAVAAIAQACFLTIGQHHPLPRRQKLHLWRACAWSVIYTTLYAHHRREKCIAGLISCYTQSSADRNIAFGAWKDIDHIILYLDIHHLEQLETVLVAALPKRAWIRRMINVRLQWMSANPEFVTSRTTGRPTINTLSDNADRDQTIVDRASRLASRVAASVEDTSTYAISTKDRSWHNRGRAEAWLEARHLKLKGERIALGLDPVLNEIAFFLGEHYDNLRQLHKKIKESFSTPGKPIIVEGITSEETRTYCVEFCKVLRRHRWIRMLPDIRHDTLTIAPNLNGQRSFFDGLWFERFIYVKLLSMAAAWGLDCSALLNYNVELPKGTETNIDIFAIIGTHPFFIECKSGGIPKDKGLDKHRHLKQLLGLSLNQVLCVKLNARPQPALWLSRGFGLTVVDQNTIFDIIQAELRSS